MTPVPNPVSTITPATAAATQPGRLRANEIGPTVGGGAAILQARDARVAERREDQTLRAEARQNVVGVQPALQQLDGNELFERAVVTFCQVTVPVPPRPISRTSR